MNPRLRVPFLVLLAIGFLSPAGMAQTYTTTFDGEENPLSEGGKWVHNGLDWATIGKKDGLAYGTQTGTKTGLQRYDDSYAHLTGFPPDQEAWGVVHIAKPDPRCHQEVEILLRWTSSAHSTSGYECFGRCLSDGSSYVQIVRWEGPLGKFTYLVDKQGADYGLKDGDTLKASIVGNLITVYVNGVQKAQVRDDKHKTGNPGIGIFLECDNGRGIGTGRDFGFKSFTARAITSTGEKTAVTESAGAAATTAAGNPLVVDLWPGAAPDEPGNIGPEKVVMSPKLTRRQVEVTESTRMVTNVTKPTITIYRPAKDKDTGTAVLICPGGGYWNLYWQLEGEEVATWLNSLGVTGIILKYRVPRRPDDVQGEPARRPMQDAQRAVSLVRSRAREWGIDPKRIGMAGFSAGGHLVIATATNFEKRTYTPIDEVDKISCRPDFGIMAYSGYLKPKDKDELSPGLHIPSDTPPVFLVHGSADVVSPVEHSVVMYLALKRAGIPAELHTYATAAHDFGVRPSDRPCSTWTQDCANWMRYQGFLKPANK